MPLSNRHKLLNSAHDQWLLAITRPDTRLDHHKTSEAILCFTKFYSIWSKCSYFCCVELSACPFKVWNSSDPKEFILFYVFNMSNKVLSYCIAKTCPEEESIFAPLSAGNSLESCLNSSVLSSAAVYKAVFPCKQQSRASFFFRTSPRSRQACAWICRCSRLTLPTASQSGSR